MDTVLFVAYLYVRTRIVSRLHDESFKILSLFGLNADLDRLSWRHRGLKCY